MHIFLETERLVLRRFTEADVGNLFDLDGDPEVMRFLTGGKSTPRDVIENETLPSFLAYYERSERFGFWAAIEKSAGAFLGWFAFHPGRRWLRRGRTRLPAREIFLGQGQRNRRISRADPQGLHRARRAARVRADDGGQHRILAGDGEGRPGVRADLPRGLAGAHRRGGARGGRVRANQV